MQQGCKERLPGREVVLRLTAATLLVYEPVTNSGALLGALFMFGPNGPIRQARP